ncbi:MAG: UDP-N-acetylglucosamine 1-carboxyvinyltransferase [Clostridia bacterium]|nr:UDP-N-acetylglucosamine 1-carboxyvinyltransferase [Clostridia bacterium]
MEQIVINGGNKLYGDIYIDGMKNAALPIIFACILTGDKCVIENLPPVSDINVSLEILRSMGAGVRLLNKTTAEIDTTHIVGGTSPDDLASKMRASTYLLGAELGRFGSAKVGAPGGCDFNSRPIDQHIKGFEALGATYKLENGHICLDAENGLKGTTVYCDMISVGATCNIMLAATLAEGTTVIENAAREPHIVDLANFLNTCGADIYGAGTNTIKIRGVKSLHGCEYTIIPDMIEAGTYMAAVAATGGRVNIRNVIPKHVESITAKLTEMGVCVEEHDDYISVSSNSRINRANIKTLPYPGFPTDMQPQFAALLCTAEGVSTVSEGIWDHRFQYVNELRNMGAQFMVEGKSATIIGTDHLSGAKVKSVDLRAGAALVIAGLAAEGQTIIENLQTLDRGYYDIVGKLRGVGADIIRRPIIKASSNHLAK